jgi:mevalonate kinase
MKKILVSAPGKIILMGEHAAVYGRPAIIAAIDKRCYVSIEPLKSKKIEIVSEDFGLKENLDEKRIINLTDTANKKWLKYCKSLEIDLLSSITKNPLDYAVIAIGETINYFKKGLPSGFRLCIDMEIPIGRGMGSSAALAVGVAGAVSVFLGEKFDKEVINKIAFFAEQKKHGLPSGGDNSTCCYGGLVWYRNETEGLKIIQPLPFSGTNEIANNFVFADTGKPVESTGKMVGMVRLLVQKRQKYAEDIFSDQEKLTKELVMILNNGKKDEVLRIIRDGERNLEKIGVVSQSAQSLIREIEYMGGAAKVCGGGGKSAGAGILLAYHVNKKALEEFFFDRKTEFKDVLLGEEGVRVEG